MTQPFIRSHMTWESPGDTQAFGNLLPYSGLRVLPAFLPDPLYISAVEINLQRAAFTGPVDSEVMILLDPAGHYAKNSGEYFYDPLSLTPLKAGDPLSHRQLARLCVAELGPSKRRVVKDYHNPPIRYSRSAGDLIEIDIPANAADGFSDLGVWFCYAIYYLDPSSYGGTSPPAEAFTLGTWTNLPVATGLAVDGVTPTYGRRVAPSYAGSSFGIRFTAPSNGRLTDTQFRAHVLPVSGRDSVTARVYTDNSGHPGTVVGVPSSPTAVSYLGTHHVVWDLASAPSLTAGSAYWLVYSPVNGNLCADIETCANDPNYIGSRADTIANMGNPANLLPNNECWRVQFTAVTV